MITQGGGRRIINITSIRGRRTLLRVSASSVSVPEPSATPINLSTMNNPALLKNSSTTFRSTGPEVAEAGKEIGSVVAFLAGDGASYITATTIFSPMAELCKSSSGL